jgi:hypothetical protein
MGARGVMRVMRVWCGVMCVMHVMGVMRDGCVIGAVCGVRCAVCGVMCDV